MNNFDRFFIIVIATCFGFLEIGLINGSIKSYGVYVNKSGHKKSDCQSISAVTYNYRQKQQPLTLLMVVDDIERASPKFHFLNIFELAKSAKQFITAFAIQKIKSRNLLIKLWKIDLIFPFNDFW